MKRVVKMVMVLKVEKVVRVVMVINEVNVMIKGVDIRYIFRCI